MILHISVTYSKGRTVQVKVTDSNGTIGSVDLDCYQMCIISYLPFTKKKDSSAKAILYIPGYFAPLLFLPFHTCNLDLVLKL